jgi:four helix bundle protein
MEANYQNLDVYKVSKELIHFVYKLLRKYPSEEKYALCDQIRRAAISVPANIAEGMGRTSIKEQKHFLEISYGSLMEVQCHLDISTELGYISKEEYDAANVYVHRIANMLNRLHALRR